MSKVDLRDLTKRFGSTVAVRAMNLSVQAGELVTVVGPSGCGKSTMLRMIAGLLAPSAGDILFDGQSILHVAAERRGAVMVFQDHLLFPTMSVGQNVGFGLKMRGENKVEINARVAEMLSLVQLPGFQDRRPDQLSGGQQQRVALARALVVRPEVLLLDEPLTNLDANLRLEMRHLIRAIQQQLAITTIFVTHDQEEAVMMADRVALMIDGELQQIGCPRAIYEQPKSRAVASFFRNENFLPGTKAGSCVHTAWGTLLTGATSPLPDGPVLVTVRPEHLQRGEPGGQNCLCVQVESDVYMGSYVQVRMQIGPHKWVGNLLSDLPIRRGEICYLHLPPERICLLPDSR